VFTYHTCSSAGNEKNLHKRTITPPRHPPVHPSIPRCHHCQFPFNPRQIIRLSAASSCSWTRISPAGSRPRVSQRHQSKLEHEIKIYASRALPHPTTACQPIRRLQIPGILFVPRRIHIATLICETGGCVHSGSRSTTSSLSHCYGCWIHSLK
jgi:hypothetical protein